MEEDPYVYPGMEVLRNRFDEADPARLAVLEYAATRGRSAERLAFPLTGDGYRATHRHLFQDVFEWADELRTTDLARPGTQFARPAFIEPALRDRFRQVAATGELAGMDALIFAAEAAHHMAELNAIHRFREGNGRTMRFHLEQIAHQAGHSIDLADIEARDWIGASIASFRGDELPVASAIGRAMGMDEHQLGRLRDAQQNGHGR